MGTVRRGGTARSRNTAQRIVHPEVHCRCSESDRVEGMPTPECAGRTLHRLGPNHWECHTPELGPSDREPYAPHTAEGALCPTTTPGRPARRTRELHTPRHSGL